MARPESRSPVGDRLSGSPQPTLSKRDKKRTMLAERLNEMVTSFGTNLRPHYEAQANAVQVDITLILRSNPYENRPLNDDPEEIGRLVTTVVGNNRPAEAVAEDDFIAGAGRLYTEFVHNINNAMEERDVNLTILANKVENGRSELRQRHQFHVRLAEEEHKLLSETLRSRLLGQAINKRNKLMKEKEHLDIGDSNAFLLHPNQFSLVNPASPGAGHKRATRNTGRRGGDPEDSGTLGAGENRRKRKLFEDPEGQSPSPMPPRSEIPSGSPWKDAKSRTANHQYEAPLYSIDRLFTEKELAMNMNTAAVAAQNFLMKLKKNGQTNGNGAAGERSAEDPEDSNGNLEINNANDDDATPAAADMERGPSQTYHATRGATRNALVDLAVAAAARDFPLGAAVPTFIPATFGNKANGAQVTAQSLSNNEVDGDIRMMQQQEGDDRLYEYVPANRVPAEYQYRAPSLLPDTNENFSLLPAVGGVPMSAQSSMGGHSEAGGAPMSRAASGMGGVSMKRTASGTGSLLGVPENGRRVRSRLG